MYACPLQEVASSLGGRDCRYVQEVEAEMHNRYRPGRRKLEKWGEYQTVPILIISTKESLLINDVFIPAFPSAHSWALQDRDNRRFGRPGSRKASESVLSTESCLRND